MLHTCSVLVSVFTPRAFESNYARLRHVLLDLMTLNACRLTVLRVILYGCFQWASPPMQLVGPTLSRRWSCELGAAVQRCPRWLTRSAHCVQRSVVSKKWSDFFCVRIRNSISVENCSVKRKRGRNVTLDSWMGKRGVTTGGFEHERVITTLAFIFQFWRIPP